MILIQDSYPTGNTEEERVAVKSEMSIEMITMKEEVVGAQDKKMTIKEKPTLKYVSYVSTYPSFK